MKISILTQPLHTNYGGLLQAYALQKILSEMGHEVWIMRFTERDDFRTGPFKKLKLKEGIKHYIYKMFGTPKFFIPDSEQKQIIHQHTDKFVEERIRPKSEKIFSSSSLRRICKRANFDAYVVGSDQVWRIDYSPCIDHFFLDFVKNSGVKRIAYAASFGVDSWNFSPQKTKKCANLARFFDAVSVREDSGVFLCKEYLGVDACHVLDPTMLLEQRNYEQLVDEDNVKKSPGNLFCYMLDKSDRMTEAVQKVASLTKLKPFGIMPELKLSKEVIETKIDSCIFPPVTAWLRSFIDAEFVLTDSFHGCVFSIIFNKPFIVFGNKTRGQARFNSLLKMFELQSRFCSDNACLTYIVNQSIEWERVNAIYQSNKKKSLDFLRTSLS